MTLLGAPERRWKITTTSAASTTKSRGHKIHATTAKPRAPTLLPHCAIILQLVVRLFGEIVIFYEIMYRISRHPRSIITI